MKTKIISLGLILTILLSGCAGKATDGGKTTQEIKTLDLKSIKVENMDFYQYYKIDKMKISPNAPQYTLPLIAKEVSNYDDVRQKLNLDESDLELLKKNGFAIVKNPFNPSEENIVVPYEVLKDNEIPIFITTDSLLHVYHIQFDETLRQIEEREFYDNIWGISKSLQEKSIQDYNSFEGDLKEASRRNVIFFTVALSLLSPKKDQICPYKEEWQCDDSYFKNEDLTKYSFTVPNFVKQDVDKELKLIENQQGFSKSPLFIYDEDYSQYIPRGHYTRSEKLKNYFKAMMWYGRMSMLLKGTDQVEKGMSCASVPPCTALISTYDAKIQTIEASLITYNLSLDTSQLQKWDRIYSVTSFYVGFSDDLGPYDYIEALSSVFNGSFSPTMLNDESVGKIKAKLAESPSPKIYGGTGDCSLSPPFSPEQANQCLEMTKGFRMMGQRFIPDSYMFSNLVGAYTGEYNGKEGKEPFTLVYSAGGPIRGFPRGRDVMYILGAERAKYHLDTLNDSKYKDYETQVTLLKKEFNSFSDKDWNRNLYWSWLYSLKPLLDVYGEGYPTFMQTLAWQDKELTTSLASWAELRHDTILYAKQSYTMKQTSAPPMEEKNVTGYVEPVPEFYNRLLSLTRMTNRGLDEMNVLDDSSKYRLQNLEKILERLVTISKKELDGEDLTQEDYDFIKEFGDELNSTIGSVEEKGKKTTIVADVHTDGNTMAVLEEGVGYVDIIVVAYMTPNGRIYLSAGPVMSYYEFKHPMSDRLTDEKWREMLSTNPPEEPEWSSNISN